MFNTRIAPSPTGDMHLGTARTAYFNWLAARASGGRFMLRIDDTDTKRNKDKHTQDILNAMDWLGLDFDELVYQSQRIVRYQKLAYELIETLDARVLGDGAVVLCPSDIPESFKDDLAGEVKVSKENRQHLLEGTVLLRADGRPTYHWASVVDDIDFGINYVIRGVDHLTNTATHVTLYRTLHVPEPRYAHVGLLYLNGKKLSKREGAQGVLEYRELGYEPEALLNWLVRMGWGPTVDDATTAILLRGKMLELFLAGGKMKNSPANMDIKKLASFQRKYVALKRL